MKNFLSGLALLNLLPVFISSATADSSATLSELDALWAELSRTVIEGDFEGITESLTAVTGGLSTAFDTTLVALVLALALSLLVSFLQSREAEWLDLCNEYCSRRVTGRLRLREH